MNVSKKKQEDCCGCSACMVICPKQAISMLPDALGFQYPKVDINKCIDCGLCVNICAFSENRYKISSYEVPLVYGARNKDKKQVAASQSGGLFFTLAKWIIQNNGVVYGAGYIEKFRVVHKRATSLEQLEELRGSKYVQSDIRNCLEQALNDALAGKYLLFSGTPCQVAGLHSLLSKKRMNSDKVFLCDIVCHAVPSPAIWLDNVMYISKKYRMNVIKTNFRNKKFGWHSSIETYDLEDGRQITSYLYNSCYYSHCMNRRSCSNCSFASIHRPSDITIGDFWGLRDIRPELDKENTGVSLVLIHSDKGKSIFEAINSQINFFESNTTDCLQPNLLHPTTESPYRDSFEKDYVLKGFKYVMSRYSPLCWRNRLLKRPFDFLKRKLSLRFFI